MPRKKPTKASGKTNTNKLYEGIPGDTPTVTVKLGEKKPTELKPAPGMSGGFNWGGKTPQDRMITAPGEQRMALAILVDYFGDETRARRFYQRFKHRIVGNMNMGQPWSLTSDQIKVIVADIEQVETGSSQAKRMVALEPSPVVSDGGKDIEWTKSGINPNVKRSTP